MNDIYPDVASLKPEELEILCNEFRRNNFIDPETSEKLGVKRGLRNADGTGVLAGLTSICDVVGYTRDEEGHVIPAEGKLIYRGIDLDRIVQEAVEKDRFMYEEVAWLLLFGDLPAEENLELFKQILDSHHELPAGFPETQIMCSPSPNIMNKMSRSVLTMYSYDDDAEDTSLSNIIKQSINLIAGLPTMMIYAYQTKLHVYDHKSMYFHYPKKGLSTAEHILSIYRPDQQYTHAEAKLLDLCMIVHMDHGGGNCSTFSDRVLSSSGTDTYAAISAAIGALKGPKHGGANLKVMKQLDYIKENLVNPADDEEVLNLLRAIIRKEKGDGSGLIYGIGHAVYTLSDPRAQILKKQSKTLAYEKGFDTEWNLLCSIERLAPKAFEIEKGTTKHVCANVDLFSGLIYRMLGIAPELYTPLFAIARIPGWCAHRMEEVEFANRIIRPAYKYVGSSQEYVPLEERTEK
ncbi:MAG: citrate synthase [Bulleidia sp.]|nr:citrate synthase [Bulleidia sp.]